MAQFSIDTEYLESLSRIGVAFSGGLDSSVLLKVLSDYPELKNKITALHVNHGVNEDSDSWEQFCKEKASELDIDFRSWRLDKLEKISEEYLRDKRYEIFEEWTNTNDVIVTGHHLDDQVETIMFRLFRGTGLKGLQGIKKFSTVGSINFYRPFLENTKEELHDYALKHKTDWIEDYSNKESYFSRNLIRNSIVPEVEKRWPHLHKSFNKISIEATKAQQVLEEVALEDLNKIQFSKEVLDIKKLKSLSDERKENLILFWLKNFNHIHLSPGQANQIFSSIAMPSEGSAILNIETHNHSTKRKIIISSKEIRVLENNSLEPFPQNMSLRWNLKDSIKIPTGELSIEESFGRGLDKKYLESDTKIKGRVGGERCKPFGRNKSQKIKNLFQEFEVPDWKRDYIPIIYINDEIAAVGDLWVCEEFHTNTNESGLSIKWHQNF